MLTSKDVTEVFSAFPLLQKNPTAVVTAVVVVLLTDSTLEMVVASQISKTLRSKALILANGEVVVLGGRFSWPPKTDS